MKIMELLEVIHNVNHLPLSEQMLIAECIIHSIREREQPMEKTIERLYAAYIADKNLTLFPHLNYDCFYDYG